MKFPKLLAGYKLLPNPSFLNRKCANCIHYLNKDCVLVDKSASPDPNSIDANGWCNLHLIKLFGTPKVGAERKMLEFTPPIKQVVGQPPLLTNSEPVIPIQLAVRASASEEYATVSTDTTIEKF